MDNGEHMRFSPKIAFFKEKESSDEEGGRWVAPRRTGYTVLVQTRAPGTHCRVAYLGLTPAGRSGGVGEQGR